MIVIRFEEPEEYHAPGQKLRRAKIFLDEEKIGRKEITVGMSLYAPGMAAPFHKHEGAEIIIITHGRGKFGTREQTIEVKAGDVLYFAPGEEHYLEGIGSQTLEFYWIYTKPGDEKPIREKWVLLK